MQIHMSFAHIILFDQQLAACDVDMMMMVIMIVDMMMIVAMTMRRKI